MWMATAKFKEITVQDSRSGLSPDDYYDLKAGRKIKNKPPKKLIDGKFVREVK